MARPPFDRSVFVNCPFDEPYKPLLDAVLFTIHDCGFVARTALEESGSGETRLDKIVRIIKESRFSIHDLSRVEVTPNSPLPRFNMPFECGLALGAVCYQRSPRTGARDFLLLAAERFQDRKTLSDLSGQDASYHDNKPDMAISAVRRFLASKSQGVLPDDVEVTGARAITDRLERFKLELPKMAAVLGITSEEIASFDYLPEWLTLATKWQRSTVL